LRDSKLNSAYIQVPESGMGKIDQFCTVSEMELKHTGPSLSILRAVLYGSQPTSVSHRVFLVGDDEGRSLNDKCGAVRIKL
jgi:hypothetical protein